MILSTVISLTLFVGGIILLLSQISFWSLFLGIAATQIGIVFLIFSYEKLSRNYVNNAFQTHIEDIETTDLVRIPKKSPLKLKIG